MEGPRRAKVSEYDELMTLINRSFYPHSREGIQREYNHIYRPSHRAASNNLIIRHQGKIVSNVGLFPLSLRVEDALLKVGGIGGVCTDANYRGQGLMSRLLKKSIKIMETEGYDISWLGGDRKRYGNFGWETAGRQYHFTVSRRHLSDLPSAFSRVRFFEESKSDLRKIAAIYEKQPVRNERTPSDYLSLFTRGKRETLLAEEGESFAYLILSVQGPHRTVDEFGGPAELLEGLAHYLFRRRKHLKSLNFSCAPGSHYIPFLLKISDTYSIGPLGMIRLINLQSTLKKLIPFLRRRASRMGVKGELALKIKGQEEEVNLTFGNRQPHYKIELKRRALSRLLFGPLEASDSLESLEVSPLIEALFPVPLYISPLNRV